MVAEQLRRLLLTEMGITSWFPRAPLPGAALSHEQCLQNFFEEPTAAVSVATVERTGISSPPVAQLAELLAQNSVASALPLNRQTRPEAPDRPLVNAAVSTTPALHTAALKASVLNPSGLKPSVLDRSAATTAHNASAVEHAEVEDFGFSWFNVDKRLAVLAMLPVGNTRLTSSCRQMLARLLAALHTPWQALKLTDQSFHWPFADDLGLPADVSAAGQAVDGFIARRLREQNCAMLLVLSDGLPWFLDQADADKRQGAQLQIHRQFGFSMLATHSLHGMEKDAGLKREAWQSMQLLRERLNQ